ncbi:tRNA 2-thiouridine(34) synthase MnmA [bacterium (Candidatus Blackallbacteria) CG17_big_fil_post_rev_8_21_14_2_50_48_46]|uniref:tRNA-specific 2-thiouridylase MnmA n=1 Tax=bacterium (Candidatus Blackallbacteria) CG17_big_fil_post_rev_8_21_14_2_50_48_46 TaxID=2014261 RepID=A0A2M7GB38_9BACT|nr:MAG: tRNA 2-thiouridine(34) synthase MnmA [bacterium (Candidatus Blackallbacteria) CG18_big_fil_WC_8_21_14_2_50_49_26]PIW19396.1 MAG: tRNA 2-thiouridine(34) synthase MnmA [bacterium (Candidatus Blackallbacteria) CG17_big_fil_post_rev_8_21_14_2_50_48_46]PIW49000.1 MAG: tRNA 2-thiouridine(34) synthase MnmA [bacterium (Candidatus Blackallbacteria) CG13_big_fil_rev_8_21_14_2_50_49_14]
MRIAVGMSGGVDSSVAAALLKKAGHEVIGVTMLIWDGSKCCSGDAIEDAEWVTKQLGIEHHVYNLIPEFTQEVVTPFVNEYLNGRTPNPCPTCNFRMKFHHLWQAVQKNLEVDKMATGHYVRLEQDPDNLRYQLYRGLDHHKDQTYMFYRLSQEQLSRLHFPLGHFSKAETRKMAGELGLEPIMNKPDSQDLCFVGDSLNDFWKNHYQKSIRHGNIVDLNGNILGSHEGIVHYTIGQRKGLGIAHEEPLYVLKINAGKNEVVVGPRDQTFSDGLEASGLNWSAIDPPTKPLKAHIRIRYRSELVPATIEVTAPDTVRVRFDDPQSAISPGQITVFYDSNDMLLGGGVIEKALVLTEPVSV